MKFKTICLIGIVFILNSCVSNTNPQDVGFVKTPYTSGNVSLTLKKGVTTKDEVINAFGSPNIVTQNASGESVWTYQTNATVENNASRDGFLTLLITGENTQESGFMQSQKTMTIIITFKGNIVSNYKSLSTNF
ncbi:hypothetical protein IB633_07010 [Francisella philomiragia]|uniref:SmpA / OmlA family protein n=1 Tax=Francisella philomiragia subsp. philomiragia (strain ATCC 25017 / CCUG 19701 / FSC 153 / O\|nr:hypothetical protein [Francisella philomiragia]AJI46570.1 hypothetical protein BF30_1550 [Francisella philomiragia]AJI49766.1 hypothetical protein KU46_9 [Francisella philomiragia]AJI56437.1 hypothetical protein LA02_960 [Francisella philomiragia]MBK2020764.1 hypothetical protein [Francisella philomiragia]MBK2030816.1 hypothetical protein [Francisella philomiragia]